MCGEMVTQVFDYISWIVYAQFRPPKPQIKENKWSTGMSLSLIVCFPAKPQTKGTGNSRQNTADYRNLRNKLGGDIVHSLWFVVRGSSFIVGSVFYSLVLYLGR